MQNDKTVEELYQELGLTPPESIKHLTEDELREALKVKANHIWKQSGTTLFCDCELGRHTTNIPTDYMLQGTDPDGKPVLKKLVIV